MASARVRSSARAVPAFGYTCRARWSPAITANATPSRSSAIAAAVACRAERIFSPDIDPETSTTMISKASARMPPEPAAVTVTTASTRVAPGAR